MIAQAKSEEQQRIAADRAGTSRSGAAGQSDEGYWAYMQRQIQERTENLGILGDNMQNLEDNSAGWASDVNKFVSQQKKSAITGRKFPYRQGDVESTDHFVVIKHKFGF